MGSYTHPQPRGSRNGAGVIKVEVKSTNRAALPTPFKDGLRTPLWEAPLGLMGVLGRPPLRPSRSLHQAPRLPRPRRPDSTPAPPPPPPPGGGGPWRARSLAAARARPGPVALIGPRASAEPGTPRVAGGSGQRPAHPERGAQIPRVGPADRIRTSEPGLEVRARRWGAWAGPSARSRGGAPQPCPPPREQNPASSLLSTALILPRGGGPSPEGEGLLPPESK